MQLGRKGLLRSNRNGPRGGENEWVLCSWPEPTLPPRTREGWGNLLRRADLERMGQPPNFPLTADRSVLYHYRNKFALRSGPEFHAEWLRDEP